jgi:MoaA/NifB/PqqE/SkfB family radical SAM enzyme
MIKMMELDQVGFHGISDDRANRLAAGYRREEVFYCEHVITARCNFRCSYCNVLDSSDDPTLDQVLETVDRIARLNCVFYHITGGEPTVRSDLLDVVLHAKKKLLAVRLSTNGSAKKKVYDELMAAGCLSFAVSLDTASADERQPAFDEVIANIKNMVKSGADVQVGTVFDKVNIGRASEIIRFISDLGVSDIKVGTASQEPSAIVELSGVEDLLQRHKILSYRVGRFARGRGMRGLCSDDTSVCSLCLDDLTIKGDKHYPCAVYLREGGAAVSTVGDEMMSQRRLWSESHDSLSDPLCRKFCMDFKCDFNNAVAVAAKKHERYTQ